jgi:Fur family ferric uptake transcriptional regulator
MTYTSKILNFNIDNHYQYGISSATDRRSQELKDQKSNMPCGRPRPAFHGGLKDHSVQNKLSEYLRTQDLKKSEARGQILEVILKNPRHFGVQELIIQVRKRHPNIGPATVYRNINLLVEAQVIRETLTTETGDKLYELSVEEHHDHIVCLDCQGVFEFHEDVIEEAQEKLGKKLKFSPVKHRHIIFAKCAFRKN